MTNEAAVKAVQDRISELVAMPGIQRCMKDRYGDDRMRGMSHAEAVEEVNHFLCQFAISTLYGVR